MEASIKDKRDTMELCHRLIPMMNEGEIALMVVALNETVERLIKEGRLQKNNLSSKNLSKNK